MALMEYIGDAIEEFNRGGSHHWTDGLELDLARFLDAVPADDITAVVLARFGTEWEEFRQFAAVGWRLSVRTGKVILSPRFVPNHARDDEFRAFEMRLRRIKESQAARK